MIWASFAVRSPDGDVFDAASLACYLTLKLGRGFRVNQSFCWYDKLGIFFAMNSHTVTRHVDIAIRMAFGQVMTRYDKSVLVEPGFVAAEGVAPAPPTL